MRRLTGDYAAAAADQRQALDLFRQLGDRLGQARALDELGLMQQQAGDYPAATASVTEAIELFRDLGSRYDLAMALNSLGELSFRTSATQEARSRHSQALAIARELGAPLRKHARWKESAAAFSTRTLPKPPRTSGAPWRSIRASVPPAPGAFRTPLTTTAAKKRAVSSPDARPCANGRPR